MFSVVVLVCGVVASSAGQYRQAYEVPSFAPAPSLPSGFFAPPPQDVTVSSPSFPSPTAFSPPGSSEASSSAFSPAEPSSVLEGPSSSSSSASSGGPSFSSASSFAPAGSSEPSFSSSSAFSPTGSPDAGFASAVASAPDGPSNVGFAPAAPVNSFPTTTPGVSSAFSSAAAGDGSLAPAPLPAGAFTSAFPVPAGALASPPAFAPPSSQTSAQFSVASAAYAPPVPYVVVPAPAPVYGFPGGYYYRRF